MMVFSARSQRGRNAAMRNWVIGASLVVGSGIVIIGLTYLGVPYKTAAVIGVIVAVGGFILQMVSAFGMRNTYERSHREREAAHRAVLEQAARLPPEQAVQLLLKN